MHHATIRNHVHIVTILLDNKADRNIKGDTGTALDIAQLAHLDELIKILETHVPTTTSPKNTEKDLASSTILRTKILFLGDPLAEKEEVLKAYAKVEPKMSSSVLHEGGVSGTIEIDGKSVQVEVVNSPDDEKSREVVYAFTDLVVIFFSLKYPRTFKHAVSRVREKIIFFLFKLIFLIFYSGYQKHLSICLEYLIF